MYFYVVLIYVLNAERKNIEIILLIKKYIIFSEILLAIKENISFLPGRRNLFICYNESGRIIIQQR